MTRTMTAAAALAAATTLFAASANAADLPAYEAAPVVAVPSFSWTGFYIGAQAGYGWSKLKRGGSATLDGALLGAYAGYNVQMDASPLVFGIETDFNWSDQDKRRNGVRGDIKWSGATRARIGYAFDRVLVYGAGGVAYSRAKLSGGGASAARTFTGWTLGGGVEYAVTDNVSVRGEYRYADYGRRSGVKLTENRIMGGVAYKF